MSAALTAALAVGDLTTALAELYDQDDFGGPGCHAAIQAVLALHVPTHPADFYPSCTQCTHGCGTGDVDWPCPTVRAITNGLKVER